MKFWKTFKSSIYDPVFYSELRQHNFLFSLKYFYTLVLFLALGATLVFGFIFVPLASVFVNSIGPAVVDYYPDDLVLNIEGGQASINKPEPYFFKVPDKLPKEIKEKGIENILVVDTKSDYSADKFAEYKTISLLTKDSIIYKGDKDAITIEPLKKFPDFTLEKKDIISWAGKASSVTKYLPIVLVGTIFFISLVVLSSHLGYLLIAALLIFFLAKIRKVNLSYWESYRIGMHAITLPLIISALPVLFTFLPHIPFAFTAILLVIVWINLMSKTSPESITPTAN